VARRQSRLTSLAGELQRRFGVDAEVMVADLAMLEGWSRSLVGSPSMAGSTG